jgi:hypothetical protein
LGLAEIEEHAGSIPLAAWDVFRCGRTGWSLRYWPVHGVRF